MALQISSWNYPRTYTGAIQLCQRPDLLDMSRQNRWPAPKVFPQLNSDRGQFLANTGTGVCAPSKFGAHTPVPYYVPYYIPVKAVICRNDQSYPFCEIRTFNGAFVRAARPESVLRWLP